MASAREGFTIDLVGDLVNKSLLNPYLTVPIAAAISWSQHTGLDASGPVSSLGYVAWALVAVGAISSANNYLTKWYANNWTRTKPDEWNWDEEIVVVTGGSSGLGASIVQTLLARNARTTVVVLDIVPLKWTLPGDNSKGHTGSRVHFYQCDLSDSSSLRSVCARVKTEVGDPTVLVNNAGVGSGLTVMESSCADIESTLGTNLKAPFLMIKEFLPAMIERDHGHVVNISSISALTPPPAFADYAASKAGLIALHESLQLELKHRNKAPTVRLTLGIFSYIRTPLFRGDTGLPHFFFPLLEVETVSEALVDVLYSGYGKTVYMPGMTRCVAAFRGAPEWVLRILRNGTAEM
ncbi:short chain dehydrogenase [Cercophora scortea]|uniref:Short chain dehydrogenase n=1 Tax=Cercophora scortea TaxID=314031 RepID=A0AAE0I7D4_9PEZI|nr:short chain dehydrogenase [Cercophora scortea]